ncbi:protein trapped in endoderm-1-like protein [Leptotrombidium deliense]|uniref:Protein trapped in endoderm-1-like protein n=1 Tax=Leptotrombidium deliense TaxID=299467 RepID=A0A443S9R3_9ACAR|nr:protein trapped in endoderm-1-like protein [Leptotrombidium deliense]
MFLNSSAENDSITFMPKNACLFAFYVPLSLAVFGALGNLFVIISFSNFSPKLLKQATTLFVINLSVSDLIFCVFNIPLTAIPFYKRKWPFGAQLCQIFPIFFYGNIAVSLLTITFITFNRFVSIVINKHYKQIYSKNTIRLMIAFCWILPFSLLSLPLFKIWGQYGYERLTFTCTLLEFENKSPKTIFFLASFIIPCIAILFCYTFIWIKVRRKCISSKREMRVTKLIFVIFTVFILCFTPSILVEMFLNKNRYPYIYVASLILVCLSACVNPIIYFILNEHYRTALKRLLLGHSRGSIMSRNDSSTSSPTVKSNQNTYETKFIYPPKL